MPRPASVRLRAARLAALAGFLVLAPRPAAAMPQPVPPRGPDPPCASGPGGLIGCIPSPGDVLSGAARTAGGGVMKVFTAFFTDGANWFLERLKELVTAPTRPDLSVAWWVEKYNLMLALAAGARATIRRRQDALNGRRPHPANASAGRLLAHGAPHLGRALRVLVTGCGEYRLADYPQMHRTRCGAFGTLP